MMLTMTLRMVVNDLVGQQATTPGGIQQDSQYQAADSPNDEGDKGHEEGFPNRLKIDGAQIVVHQWASSVGVGTVADAVGAAELDTSSRIRAACSTA